VTLRLKDSKRGSPKAVNESGVTEHARVSGLLSRSDTGWRAINVKVSVWQTD